MHGRAIVEWARERERPIHERGESVVLETASKHADGTEHYNWILKYPVTDEAGNLSAIGGVVLDITDRRRAEIKLAETEAEQAALRRVATTVAATTDSSAVFRVVAEEMARVFSAEAGAVVRFNTADEGEIMSAWTADPNMPTPASVPLDSDNATSLVARTGRAAQVSRKDGATPILTPGVTAGVAAPILIAGHIWGAVTAASTTADSMGPGSEGRAMRFARLAATAIANAEARELLAAQASTDELTALPNYRTFHSRLNTEVERATRHHRSLGLLAIDIDLFKGINDTHGHGVGDLVLAEVARRLKHEMRDGDLVARVGGEEFAWILPETDEAGARIAAQRALHAITRDPFAIAGCVTISIGVAELDQTEDGVDILRKADEALYAAKRDGRNMSVRYSSLAKDMPNVHAA